MRLDGGCEHARETRSIVARSKRQVHLDLPGSSDRVSAVKLNRLVARHAGIGRNAARLCIAAGRVAVDGEIVTDGSVEIDRFRNVLLDGDPLRPPERRIRILLYKPRGILSATADAVHPTVIDLIDHPEKHTLHLAGRLDRDSSGLVLLTNDGAWSKRLMDPAAKVAKIYQVETREPIPADAVAAFARGFHFHTEDVVTMPAVLDILGPRHARVTLHEGRYHQIKRMFHRVGNRVTALHRESIGRFRLPDDLGPGEWREISDEDHLDHGDFMSGETATTGRSGDFDPSRLT